MSSDGFNVFDDEQARKRDRRNGVAQAVALALAACFVLGVILCLGLLVRTVVNKAETVDGSIASGAKSLNEMEQTAANFNAFSQKAIQKLQISMDQMAKDLDTIAKKISGLPILVAQRTLNCTSI
jgi:predicted PurR-regulated permease PerM